MKHNILAALIITTGLVHTAAIADEPYPIPGPKTRIYTIGNSYTNSTFNTGLEAMCESGGHEVERLRTAGVAGASLKIIMSADIDDMKQYLAGEKWDILTLQTYYGSIEAESAAAVEMVRMARVKNPDVRVIMFTIWPPYSVWTDPPKERSEAWTEAVRDNILKEFPDQIVQVAPVSLIFQELYPLIDAGKIPNLPYPELLFRDGGHPGKYGAYPINACVASMIYHEKPFDYGTESVEGQSVEAATARAMQKVVWDVLMTYPGALMNDKPTISTRRLDTAVKGLAYDKQLEAINVADKARWRLAEGKLPDGVAITAGGKLRGVPAETGQFDFTVEMRHGDATSTRSYTLKVDPDDLPAIVTGDIPTAEGGKWFSYSLKSTAGVGRHEWRIGQGKLPPGMQLLPTGTILGTPGRPGRYPVTFTVTDQHPQGRQTADKLLTLEVSDPPAGTVHITKYEAYTDPHLDGVFDEPYWNFDKTIEKTVQGDPTATVRWATFWLNSKLYIGAKVKVGKMGKTPADAIDVFIDGNNNDEVIYNYDDAHWRFKRANQRPGEKIIAGYMRFFNSGHGITETEDGWNVEIVLDRNALRGRGIITAWPDFAVYGFDIAVRQGDKSGKVHQKVWQGTIDNPKDTSKFGTIIFRAEAGKPNYAPYIRNGDFTMRDYATFNIIGGRNFPKHEWIRQTKNVGGPAWTFKRGEGFVHDNPKSTVTGLMQVFDRPEAGTYVLGFKYKAPRAGFHTAMWGATVQERGNMGVDTLRASEINWPDAAQYLDPHAIAKTGDDKWRTVEIPVTITGQAEEIFLVFKTGDTGDTGVAIGDVSFEPRK